MFDPEAVHPPASPFGEIARRPLLERTPDETDDAYLLADACATVTYSDHGCRVVNRVSAKGRHPLKF
jgi:hypothetical protein